MGVSMQPGQSQQTQQQLVPVARPDGTVVWVDPATGISLAYLTTGHDRNSIRQGRRGVAISSIAAEGAL